MTGEQRDFEKHGLGLGYDFDSVGWDNGQGHGWSMERLMTSIRFRAHGCAIIGMASGSDGVMDCQIFSHIPR